MDNQKRFTWPIVLALVLHLTLLGLFILSALYKPAIKEPEPVSEVIHATMIDTASLQEEAAAIKKADAEKVLAEKAQIAAQEKKVLEENQAEAEKAKAEGKNGTKE